jgi:hypothetical protein
VKKWEYASFFCIVSLLGCPQAEVIGGHFQTTIRNDTSHEISNDNGVRLMNFAKLKNLIISSLIFPHHDIHSKLGLLLMG